jgi:hypothetical protein
VLDGVIQIGYRGPFLSFRIYLEKFLSPSRNQEIESTVKTCLNLAEEVKKRVLRITLNSTVLVVLAIALNITIPGALAIISSIPSEGLSLSTALILLLVIVMAFQALRIILDLVRLVDLFSELLVKHIPGLKTEGKVSVVKALKEIIIVIVLVIITTAVFPFTLLVPELEPWLSIGVSMTSIIVSIILLYDAGKTLYAVFQSGLDFFIDRIVGNGEQVAD